MRFAGIYSHFKRELRNTKIIAVDYGYGNMKTANTVTPTGIKAYKTEPIFTGNILEYNGIYYRIGEGHKEFIPDKAMDEEYYFLTLMAVFLSLRQTENCPIDRQDSFPDTDRKLSGKWNYNFL